MSSSREWIDAAKQLLDHLADTQLDAIDAAAAMCADAIAAGGLVHLFGSGHSRMPVEEMFPRYGSYPGFHPMVELSMTFHTEIVGTNSQPAAMFIERVEGLADVILSGFHFGEHDIFFVFSASGRSAVPIEMAMGAKDRRLPVVAVTSLEESKALPTAHPSGLRLFEVADHIIDIGTPAGDALVQLEGLAHPVGPGSTISNTAIVNAIKVRTAELLIERDAMPPVLTAASLVGATESRRLFDQAYAEHGRRIASVLAKPISEGSAM